MNSTMLYAFRTTTHLPIPSAVLDMIAAMQMAPVAPGYLEHYWPLQLVPVGQLVQRYLEHY